MKEVAFSGDAPAPDAQKLEKTKTAYGSTNAQVVRTYRADVERLISQKKITRTHVAIAEEERRRALGESAVWEEEKPSTLLPAIVAGCFLLAGVSILFYDLAGGAIAIFPSWSAPNAAFLVPGEESETLGLRQFTKNELSLAIHGIARERKIPQGEHVRIAYVARTGTTTLPLPYRNFFRILGANPPDTFLRSVAPAYEGGLVGAGETKGYLVFTTTYYENTAVGLLSWEKQLVSDLYPVIDPLRTQLGPAPQGAWRTQTWEGKDLRVFETSDGRIAFVYGWIERKVLVMAGNIQSWSEIARLLSEQAP